MTRTERRARAVKLVKGGMSYGEAAKALGTTRNVVASACHAVGHRTGGIRPRHRKKFVENLDKIRNDPDIEARRIAAVNEAWRSTELRDQAAARSRAMWRDPAMRKFILSRRPEAQS